MKRPQQTFIHNSALLVLPHTIFIKKFFDEITEAICVFVNKGTELLRDVSFVDSHIFKLAGMPGLEPKVAYLQ